MSKLEEIRKQLDQARIRVAELEVQYNDEFTRECQVVDSVKRGDTITLTFGGRELKVTRNMRGRWRVKEGGKVIDGDYTWGMRNLKHDFALGKI